MSFRSYDVYAVNYMEEIADGTYLDKWHTVGFDYRYDTDESERVAKWIDTFATGPFVVSLRYIMFTEEKDAVFFKMKYGNRNATT